VITSVAQTGAGVSPAIDGRIPESGNVCTPGLWSLVIKRPWPPRPGINMPPELDGTGAYEAGFDCRFLPSRRFAAVTMRSAE
jgi:hypothetical protein